MDIASQNTIPWSSQWAIEFYTDFQCGANTGSRSFFVNGANPEYIGGTIFHLPTGLDTQLNHQTTRLGIESEHFIRLPIEWNSWKYVAPPDDLNRVLIVSVVLARKPDERPVTLVQEAYKASIRGCISTNDVAGSEDFHAVRFERREAQRRYTDPKNPQMPYAPSWSIVNSLGKIPTSGELRQMMNKDRKAKSFDNRFSAIYVPEQPSHSSPLLGEDKNTKLLMIENDGHGDKIPTKPSEAQRLPSQSSIDMSESPKLVPSSHSRSLKTLQSGRFLQVPSPNEVHQTIAFPVSPKVIKPIRGYVRRGSQNFVSPKHVNPLIVDTVREVDSVLEKGQKQSSSRDGEFLDWLQQPYPGLPKLVTDDLLTSLADDAVLSSPSTLPSKKERYSKTPDFGIKLPEENTRTSELLGSRAFAKCKEELIHSRRCSAPSNLIENTVAEVLMASKAASEPALEGINTRLSQKDTSSSLNSKPFKRKPQVRTWISYNASCRKKLASPCDEVAMRAHQELASVLARLRESSKNEVLRVETDTFMSLSSKVQDQIRNAKQSIPGPLNPPVSPPFMTYTKRFPKRLGTPIIMQNSNEVHTEKPTSSGIIETADLEDREAQGKNPRKFRLNQSTNIDYTYLPQSPSYVQEVKQKWKTSADVADTIKELRRASYMNRKEIQRWKKRLSKQLMDTITEESDRQ